MSKHSCTAASGTATPGRLTVSRRTALIVSAALLVALTAATAGAQAEGNPSADGQLRPGATLAPPVIKDLRIVIRDVIAVSTTRDERRDDTSDQVKVTLGAKILFGKDSAALNPAARARIRDVSHEIRAARSPKVTIAGYTDDLGSAAHGLALSRQRAEAIRDVLRQELGAGVTYTVQGFGEAHPIADNGTARGRELNRRVAITYPVISNRNPVQ
ncbi:OmpA family protein [Streptomyces sp. NPDC005525]|uniref:OmpA family protein n=1 Tax=Streptomyces sp. NPDC005525 TaxID=3364720 RepID=UPI00368DE316